MVVRRASCWLDMAMLRNVTTMRLEVDVGRRWRVVARLLKQFSLEGDDVLLESVVLGLNAFI